MKAKVQINSSALKNRNLQQLLIALILTSMPSSVLNDPNNIAKCTVEAKCYECDPNSGCYYCLYNLYSLSPPVECLQPSTIIQDCHYYKLNLSNSKTSCASCKNGKKPTKTQLTGEPDEDYYDCSSPSNLSNCIHARLGKEIAICDLCAADFERIADGACSAVPSEKKIKDCMYYENGCLLCKPGFSLVSRPRETVTCEVTPPEHQGCLFILSGVCSQCQYLNGYFTSGWSDARGNICGFDPNFVGPGSSATPLNIKKYINSAYAISASLVGIILQLIL